MAVIVVNGADFSANNLGRIDIFTEFHPTTLSVFSKFGVTADDTNELHKATDSFVRKLIAANLWGNGKIDRLALPFLADLSATKTVSNAVHDCIGDGYVLMRANTSSTPDGQNLLLSNHGLKPNRNEGICSKFIVPASFTANSFHLAAYTLTNETVEEALTKPIFGKFNGQLASNLSPETNWFLDTTNMVTSPYTELRNVPKMIIATLDSQQNDGKGVLYDDGNKMLSPNTNRATTTSESFFRFGAYTANVYSATASGGYICPNSSFGILSLGGYLTEEGVGIYELAAKQLVDAIHNYDWE